MLVLDTIETYYDTNQVLWGVSLNVGENSVVALLGRNGMGKTTVVRSIIGFNPPRSGAIYFRGKVISTRKPYEICQMGIGLVPQGRRIFGPLTVKENLLISAREREDRNDWSLDKVYSLFPILKERASRIGTTLSGGEQQMLAISRALLTNPDLLLMDEASEGLAPLIIEELSSVIKQLKGSGLSILLVEQNISLALSVADYVYIIDKGRIVYESTPEELRKNEEVQDLYLGVGR